jgi:hypothetical protein
MSEELRSHGDILSNVQAGCGSNPACYSMGMGGGGDEHLPHLVPLSRMNGTVHYTLWTPPYAQDFIVSYQSEELSVGGMILPLLFLFIIENDYKMVFKV